MIHVSDSGLLTIAGGKWTTYRKMAEEAVDTAVEACGLRDRVKSGCVTENVRLVGSDAWTRNMFIGLIQRVRSGIMEFAMCSRPCLVVRAADTRGEAFVGQLR